MISKNIDIVAVFALLLAMLISATIRDSVWTRFSTHQPRVKVERIHVEVPQPPIVPIVYE
jgi:hypothetical protein